MQTIKCKGMPPQARDAYEKIVQFFFAFPQEEFSLNEIAKKLVIAKMTANRIVTKLEKEGFLQKKVIGKLWQVHANQSHKYFTTKKIPYNLQLVYESDIREWITKNIKGIKTIIFFGSYRKGDDIRTSDLDIAVEVQNEQEQKIYEVKVEEMGYRKDIQMHIHCFSRKRIDKNLFANIANGIILEGFLEVYS